MRVQFWGTRGSIPAPGPATVKYGGNTSCVALRTDDGTNIVLDCGSGARTLGEHLQTLGRPEGSPLRIHLFVGHTHWDHIQGFPFFLPAFLPDAEVNVFAPSGFQRNLEDSLSGQMQYSYFPVRLQELQARLHFTELEEGFFRVGNVLVETQYLNHTNPTIGYRITADGAAVVYSTDHEPFWIPGGADFKHPGDRRHVAFLEGADLIIHDAQYTEEEYPSHFGWGHSTWEYATDVAIAAGAKTLALFHHDPARDDAAVLLFEEDARRRVERQGSALRVLAAAEGLELEVRGSKNAPNDVELSALRRRPITGSRVLVVGGSVTESTAIIRELEEESFVCSRATTQAAALALAQQAPPDLAIVQSRVTNGQGINLVKQLRAKARRADLPVLVLTDRPEPGDGRGPLLGASDYVARPYSPPMLRSRVRAWLARGATDAELSDTDARALGVMASSRTLGERRGERARLSRAQLRSAIAAVSVFRTLSPEQIDALSQRAAVEHYASGYEIIRQNRDVDSLFVVLSGRVRVLESAEEPDQYELVLADLGAGELFGEVASLADRGRSAIVVAVEQTTCLVVPADAFSEVVRAAPGLAMSLLQLLAGRIHDTDRRLAHYAPDPLTGLARRRAFHDLYAHIAAQGRRAGVGVVLGLIDIVNLKGINDRFGYAVGDEVVRTVADALRESARKSDLVARYGGDELAVLLVGARDDTMELIDERIRQRLAELAPRRGIPGTVSCAYGAAIAPNPPETADELFLIADQDMQRRKARRPR